MEQTLTYGSSSTPPIAWQKILWLGVGLLLAVLLSSGADSCDSESEPDPHEGLGKRAQITEPINQ